MVVCNARTAHSAAVAEWVVAAILTEIKRFPLFLRHQADHHALYAVALHKLKQRLAAGLGRGPGQPSLKRRMRLGAISLQVSRWSCAARV